MNNIKSIKTNFTAGELSHEMLGRGDLSAYSNGAMKLRNVFVNPTGGVERRSGLRFVDEVSKKARLVSFEFNTEQIYLLAFSDYKIDVYKDDVNVATISSPWSEEQLKNICWTQSADTLLVVHPDVKPKKITRTGHTSWLINDWVFAQKDNKKFMPFYKFVDDEITLNPSSTSGSITLTASLDVFQSLHVGTIFELQGGQVEITAVSSPTSANATVKANLSSSGTTKDWKEQAFSQVRGYPISVTYHQDRMVIGGAKSLPNRLWFSKSSDLMNFDLGEGLDDEAIEFSILSDQVNAIRGVFSGRHLQVLTSGAEWMVTGSPLTPTNIQLKRQTRVGSKNDRYIPPIDIDGATIFISSNGKEIKEFLFSDIEQAYQSNDLAILSKHLMNNPVDQDYSPSKRLLFVVMEDGSLATVTNYRMEKVTAWSKLQTSGSFLSVSAVGGDVYFVVKRDERFFIEKLDDELMLDCALTGYSQTAKTVWSGLDHLNGKTVKVIADGAVLPDQLVENNSITLPYAVNNISAGLGYEHQITPLPCMILSSNEVYPPKSVRLIEARFRLKDTASLVVDVGRGARNIPLKKLGTSKVLDSAPPEVTGDISIKSFGWIRDILCPAWEIKSDIPLRLTLLSVTTETKVNM